LYFLLFIAFFSNFSILTVVIFLNIFYLAQFPAIIKASTDASYPMLKVSYLIKFLRYLSFTYKKASPHFKTASNPYISIKSQTLYKSEGKKTVTNKVEYSINAILFIVYEKGSKSYCLSFVLAGLKIALRLLTRLGRNV